MLKEKPDCWSSPAAIRRRESMAGLPLRAGGYDFVAAEYTSSTERGDDLYCRHRVDPSLVPKSITTSIQLSCGGRGNDERRWTDDAGADSGEGESAEENNTLSGFIDHDCPGGCAVRNTGVLQRIRQLHGTIFMIYYILLSSLWITSGSSHVGLLVKLLTPRDG